MGFSIPFYLMRTIRPALLALPLLLAGCGDDARTVEDLRSRTVTLPGGQTVKAEMKMHRQDILTGMKYRESLPPDRGMLFMYGKPGAYSFWMYEVKIPLDIIWMDQNRRIVEIYQNAQPCPGPPEKCLVYGGSRESMYVLELAGGMVKRYNLAVGQQLDF
jgi:uncharacterized membrane protein (UPF0127 family)